MNRITEILTNNSFKPCDDCNNKFSKNINYVDIEVIIDNNEVHIKGKREHSANGVITYDSSLKNLKEISIDILESAIERIVSAIKEQHIDLILAYYDDLVDEWNDSDSTQELYEYLGLSLDDYAVYVLYPNDFAEDIIEKNMKESVSDEM